MLHPKLNAPVGVILLCAKTDEKARITPIVSTYFKRTTSILEGYPTFILDAEDSQVEERLVVADCGEMANVSAASRTGYLATRFNPNLMVFVGTAGTLQPDKCRIGDVVVPTLGVVSKYYDKIEDGGGEGFDGNTMPSQAADLGAFTKDKKTYTLRKKMNNFKLTGQGRDYISEAMGMSATQDLLDFDLQKLPLQTSVPAVHVDSSVFSWDMILASDHYRSLLIKQIDSKAYAVDMESFGFLNALLEFQAPPADKAISSVVVRGISDDCGNKHNSFDTGRNHVATDNAAHVACRIIKNGYMKW